MGGDSHIQLIVSNAASLDADWWVVASPPHRDILEAKAPFSLSSVDWSSTRLIRLLR